MCAGQAAVDANGAPQHAGDIGKQAMAALDNLEFVLKAADMTLSNVVRLTVYTTDVDALIPHYGALTERLRAANVQPASTLLGVTALAFGLMVEIEATAVA